RNSRSPLCLQYRKKNNTTAAAAITNAPETKSLMTRSSCRLGDHSVEQQAYPGEPDHVASQRQVGVGGEDGEVDEQQDVVQGEHDETRAGPQNEADAAAKVVLHQQHAASDARQGTQEVD